MQSMSHELVDPASVGVDSQRLDLLLRRTRLEVESGRLPSCQVALARHGRLVAFETCGDATPSSRYILQSAARPILASIAWKVIGDGLLDLDERVADVIPEFGTNGKEVITLRQVMTHTAGFPMAPLGYPRHRDRDERLAAFSRWRLDWEPGSRLQYHVTSGGWVIKELIECRTGMELRDYLREKISGPLGLTIDIGPPVEEQATVARYVCTDAKEGEFEINPWGPWYLHDPEVLAAGEPSHTVVATAGDIALLFQALYHSGLWTAEAVAEGTRAQVDMPMSGDFGRVGEPTRMGLFVLVGTSNGGAPPGPTASPATFGHSGAPTQQAWCDPESGLSFAFVTNGYPAAGYDRTRAGANQAALLTGLAFDCVPPED
jgi:CubicO group peptidase (beta-lactamase class C family)